VRRPIIAPLVLRLRDWMRYARQARPALMPNAICVAVHGLLQAVVNQGALGGRGGDDNEGAAGRRRLPNRSKGARTPCCCAPKAGTRASPSARC
jgi:hypothetical protein